MLFTIAALLGALAGTITDLKERIVPNWVSYSMIAFGLFGHLILSLLNKSFIPILYSLAGSGVFFGIAMLMFYAGAWGGGDTKLLVGFGALLPVYPLVLLNWFNPALAIWPFMFTLWINILIFGAVIGLGFGIYIIVKNFSKFIKDFKKVLVNHRIFIHIITATGLIPIISYLLKFRFAIIISFIWAICAIFFYIYIFTKSVENISMYKIINVKKLVEGDWIVNKVFKNSKLIYTPTKIGVLQKDIDRLIKLNIKSVKVKEGLPMVPAFLIGLIASLVFGDILFMLLQLLF